MSYIKCACWNPIKDGQDLELSAVPNRAGTLEEETSIEKRLIFHRTPYQFDELISGDFITVHHTLKDNDKLFRINIAVACFDISGLQLVAIDQRGNIFILKLFSKTFRRHPEVFRRPTAIVALKKKPGQYIVGSNKGMVAQLDVDVPKCLQSRRIHKDAIREISIAEGTWVLYNHLALVRSHSSAALISLYDLSCTHRLYFNKFQFDLKMSTFLPKSHFILTGFCDDSVQIWSQIPLKIIQELHPIKLRDQRLQQADPVPEIFLNWQNYVESGANFNYSLNRNIYGGLIADWSYQPASAIIAFSTQDNYLLIVSTRTWKLTSLFRMKDCILVEIFLMKIPNYSLIVALSNLGFVVLLDYEKIECKLIIELGSARSIQISLDYKYLTVCRFSGELAIWSLNLLKDMFRIQNQRLIILYSAFKYTKPIQEIN